MTSYVENETEMTFPFDCREILESVMEEVLTSENCPYEAQVNLLITDNDGIQEYNRQFRDKDMPTDVLSFPMIPFRTEADFSVAEEAEADYFDPDSGELILGDIIISAERVFQQAESFGPSPRREFAFLTAHSLLHLCGYDHMVPEEAAVMKKKQEAVLEKLGITRDI